MTPIPIEILNRACRIYAEQAYPDGPDTYSDAARELACLSPGADVRTFFATRGVIRELDGVHPGLSIRLGCAAFPFLRLVLQEIELHDGTNWLFAVDTHDSWHHPDHADAAGWLSLQSANRELKSRIETAWDKAGILTHNRLLRQELQPATSG